MTLAANGRLFGASLLRIQPRTVPEVLRTVRTGSKQKAGRLSRGQKTRFQLAFALSHQAKLYIMDEPAAGLDRSSGRS